MDVQHALVPFERVVHAHARERCVHHAHSCGATDVAVLSCAQLSSSPSAEFLNRYSTSSIAEDKAEIWACLMCYQQVLKTPALKAKAAILKQRAHKICSEMNEQWWRGVIDAQQQLVDHWEVHYADAHRGRAFWCNWVTEERRWDKPTETASMA